LKSDVRTAIKNVMPEPVLLKAKMIRTEMKTLKRKLTKRTITLDRLKSDLLKAGFSVGDKIMVHSSLSRIGNVDGGAQTVIKSLLETILPGGTVLMPCYDSAADVQAKSLNGEYTDLRQVQPYTGIISKIFGTWPNVVRSSHPFSSVCAIGSKAEYFIKDHASAPYICHDDSPIMRLIGLQGKVVGIGIALAQGMGVAHCLDDMWNEFPFEVHSPSFLAKYIDTRGNRVEREVFRYDPVVAEKRIDHPKGQWICEKLTAHLRKKGIMKFFKYGLADAWYMRADILYEELKRLAYKGVTMYLSEDQLDEHNKDTDNW